jgi:hypothetical protein
MRENDRSAFTIQGNLVDLFAFPSPDERHELLTMVDRNGVRPAIVFLRTAPCGRFPDALSEMYPFRDLAFHDEHEAPPLV